MSNIAPVDPQTQREVLATYLDMHRDPAAERLAAQAVQMAALEAWNARLRGLLRVHTLADKLHLSQSEAHILVALYDAPRPMTTADILKIIPAAWRGARSHVVNVHICRMRQKLGAEAIVTINSAGYRLSDSARARVQIVLEDAP